MNLHERNQSLASRLEALLPKARMPKAIEAEPIGYDAARSFVDRLRSGMATEDDYRHALEWAEWLESL